MRSHAIWRRLQLTDHTWNIPLTHLSPTALVHKESPCTERKHLESGQRVSLHAIPTFKTFQIEKNASDFLLNSCSCCSISWSSKYFMARITSDTQPKWKYLHWINWKKISSQRFLQRQPGSAMYHGPQSFHPLLQLPCKVGKKCRVNMRIARRNL